MISLPFTKSEGWIAISFV